MPTLLGFPASWYISDCCSKRIEYICIDTIIRVSNEWDYVYVFKKKIERRKRQAQKHRVTRIKKKETILLDVEDER